MLEYTQIYSNILDISLSGGHGVLPGGPGGHTDNPDRRNGPKLKRSSVSEHLGSRFREEAS
jgi:hypothetical protein